MFKDWKIIINKEKVKIGDCVRVSIKVFGNEEFIFNAIITDIDIDKIFVLAKSVNNLDLFAKTHMISQDPTVRNIFKEFKISGINRNNEHIYTYLLKYEHVVENNLVLELIN